MKNINMKTAITLLFIILFSIGYGQSIRTNQGNEARCNKDSLMECLGTYNIHLSNIDKESTIALIVYFSIKERGECQINNYFVYYHLLF